MFGRFVVGNGSGLFVAFVVVDGRSLVDVRRIRVTATSVVLCIGRHVLYYPNVSFSPIAVNAPRVCVHFRRRYNDL